MQAIVDYDDYREIIRDYYLEKKSRFPFSWRLFAQKAGFSSPNFVKLVCDGKSGLSLKSAEKIAHAIGITGVEQEYFKKLVLLNQSQNSAERKKLSIEVALLKQSLKIRVLKKESSNFYSSWRHQVLRELIPMMHGASNADIASKCRGFVTENEVDESKKMLAQNGYIVQDDKGCFSQANSILVASSEALPKEVRSMHKKMAEFAYEAIDDIPVNERNFSGITMGIDEECYSEITKEIDNFRKKIISIITANKSGNRVYRMNLQLFPLTDRT